MSELEYYQNVRHDAIALLDAGSYGRVAELGCGTGNTLGFLKTQGRAKFVAGLEVMEHCRAHRHPALDLYVTGDGQQWDFGGAEARYDLIMLLDVVEHIQSPYDFLQRCSARLNPGGQLLVSLPNINNLRLLSKLILKDRWDYSASGLLDETHLRFFTRTSFLERMATRLPQLQLVREKVNYDDLPLLWLWKSLPLLHRMAVIQNIYLYRTHP